MAHVQSTSQVPADHLLPPLLRPPYKPDAPRSLPRRVDADDVFATVKPELKWKVSTHACAAAWPRTRQRSAQHRSKPLDLTKFYSLGYSGRANTPEEAAWLAKHQVAPLVDLSDPRNYEDQYQLWTAIHRYVPVKKRQGSRGYTLLCCHAGGFHGQSFEVMLAYLLASPAGEHIDEVWAMDGANNGDSALLNRGMMGDTYGWIDNARDVASFMLRYLPEKGSPDPPYLLQELPVDADLLKLDYRSRPSSLKGEIRGHRVLGVGQSYGGATITLAEVGCPGLFSAMAYLDAMLTRRPEEDQVHAMASFGEQAIVGVLARRDHWASREAITKAYSNNGAFASYHDDVLRRYIEHAFTDSPKGGIELKCEKQQEALLFIEPYTSVTAAADRLHEFSERLAARCHFILASPTGSWVLSSDHKKNLRALKGATSERVDSAHLVVQERPEEVAAGIERFIARLDPPSQSVQAKL